MVYVVADLVEGGIAADEVDQRDGATVAALAKDTDEANQELLLVCKLVDFTFEGAAAAFIGTAVEGAFDFALDTVGAGDGTCALKTLVSRKRMSDRGGEIP